MLDKEITFKIIPGSEAASLVDPFYAANDWPTSRARAIDTFAVALHKEKIVGSVRLCSENGIYMLRTMMIDPDFRKKGLGARLLKYYEDKLLKDIKGNVYCTPYSHLDGFYSIIGFQDLGVDQAPPFIVERIAEYKAKGKCCLFMERQPDQV